MNEFDDDMEVGSNEPSTDSRRKGKRARTIFSYSQLKMREGLVRFIASMDIPFSFADDPNFEEFVKTYLNPAYTRVSINTIKSDCFRVFNQMKKSIISELLSSINAKVSCTSSIWSSCTGHSYIFVTAHYIDSNWTLLKKNIGFRMLEYPLNADNIFETTMSIFREYGIADKVFCITFENHTLNNEAIEMIKYALRPLHAGQIYHGKCACHIISLIVRDSLKIMDALVDKIRNAILFISSSPTRQQEFFKLCRIHRLKAKKVKPDISTRWNSTYLMIQSCLNYNKVINYYIDEIYTDNIISQEDWDLAFTFIEFLKVFYNATNDCSNVYYPTSCIFLIQMYDISHAFSTYREKGIFVEICNVMEEKFKKYWEYMPPIFCLAAVMDPRISLTGVEVLLNGISKNLNMSLSITIDDVRNLITSIFTTYESKYANKTKTDSTSFPSSSSSSAWTILANLRKQKITSSSELQKYLEIDFRVFLTDEEVENFDILSWWKSHKGIFPILSIMACDLLTTPVSTVASESAFHEFNRELDERKSRLSGKMVDCLMCLKDWEHARLRIQNQKDDIIEDFANLYIEDDNQ